MFKFLILLLLSWSVQGDAESEVDTRILGGKEAPEGLAPYQVSLRTRNEKRHFCGGSILNSNWIISAAHCTEGVTPDLFIVVVGTNSLSSGGDWYNVSKIVNHENYDEYAVKNDIVVMKIEGEFTFNDKVKPINLASSNTDAGTECLLTGWGYADNQETVPDKLQMLTVKTIPIKECNERLGDFVEDSPIDDSQICTFVSKGKGACLGDSGGPLVCKSELVGLVSFGVPCARGDPDVFTRVAAFKDWINDKISK